MPPARSIVNFYNVEGEGRMPPTRRVGFNCDNVKRYRYIFFLHFYILISIDGGTTLPRPQGPGTAVKPNYRMETDGCDRTTVMMIIY